MHDPENMKFFNAPRAYFNFYVKLHKKLKWKFQSMKKKYKRPILTVLRKEEVVIFVPINTISTKKNKWNIIWIIYNIFYVWI